MTIKSLGFLFGSVALVAFVISPQGVRSQITNPGVQQKGSVTTGHLATWTSAGVIQDGGAVPGGTGTVTSITCTAPITCTPDPIIATGTLSLANTAVVAGAYPSSAAKVPTFTVDAQGRLTAAGSQDYTGTVVLAAGNFANPSASVGLAAVNGSATTAMRSDGAPALSQAIAPTWTGRHIWGATPVYDLSANTVAMQVLFGGGASSLTVAASKELDFARIATATGGIVTVAPGASATVTGFNSQLGVDATAGAGSNVYGAVLHCTNAGAANCRGAHLEGAGSAGSTGSASAAALQAAPVTGMSGVWGGFASLTTSSGAHDIAIGLACENGGTDRWALCFGNTVSASLVGTAYYRAWMDQTNSSANARAFQTLNTAGTEIHYISKTGINAAPLGAAGTPSYTFKGDENTGMWSVAADNLSFSTGGTERCRINTTGLSCGNNLGGSITGSESAFFSGLIGVGTVTTGPAFILGDTGSGTAVIGGFYNQPVEVRANNVAVMNFMPARHLAPQTAGAPALTSCGTSPAISGTDVAGEVTLGTTATGCVITFNVAYAAAPYCTVTDQSQLTSFAYAVALDKITITQTSTTNNKINYMCMARVGG